MIILCLFFVILLVLGIIYFYPSKSIEDDKIIIIKYSDYIDEYNSCFNSATKRKEELSGYNNLTSNQLSMIRKLDKEYNDIVENFLEIHKVAIEIVKRNEKKRTISTKEKDKLKEYLTEMDNILNEFTRLVCQYEDIIDEIKETEKKGQKEKREYKKDENYNIREKTSTENSFGFFDGCDSQESLDKRYRALCKIYHPDNINGDEDVFKCIVEEYDCVKKEISDNR